jgi:cell division protein FtsL
MLETIDSLTLSQTLAILLFLFAVFLAMAWVFFPDAERQISEQRRQNRAERVKELIVKAAWHREQLDAAADEMAEIHGLDPRSDAGEELTAVVLFGVEYDYALERVSKNGNGH